MTQPVDEEDVNLLTPGDIRRTFLVIFFLCHRVLLKIWFVFHF